MYRLSKDDVKLLNNLLLLKDLNPEDGYSKENVIEYVKADRELNEAELNQTIWNDEEETKKVTLLNCSIVDLPCLLYTSDAADEL